ncbi:MAG: hypothetical protein AAFP19_20965 [Bacteroidota bacterium]
MKSLLKIGCVILALGIANLAYAGPATDGNQPGFTIKKMGEKTILLDTKDMASAFVEVSFQDGNGQRLFSEYVIHTQLFERKYNLSELKAGKYWLIVKSDTKTQMLPIQVGDEVLSMDFNALETI